jgi:predicted small metal-binding protein
MGMSLACNAVDPSSNCPYVAHGNSEDQILKDTADHAKSVHGYTDEQLNDPELMKTMKSLIKQD